MYTEEQIKKIRGSGNVPEYKDIFPPNVASLYDNELVSLIGEANRAIGNLNSYARVNPNPDLLVKPLLLREALASSKIEGTQATARDIVEHDAGVELPFPLLKEVIEVINHREATNIGLDRMKNVGETFTFRTALIKEMHQRLMMAARGESLRPGEFRLGSNVVAKDDSNDVKDIIYLPPEAIRVNTLMEELEAYLNEKDSGVDTLLRCALAHYQFEAIHPFGDGNGRIGRVLLSLFLIKEGVLEYPLLYISGYLLRERANYYKSLLDITESEAWANWLKFFLRGVKEQATRSRKILEDIFALHKEYEETVREEMNTTKGGKLVEEIFQHPVIEAKQVMEKLGVQHNTAIRFLREATTLGLLRQETKKSRNIPFYNEKLISILEEA